MSSMLPTYWHATCIFYNASYIRVTIIMYFELETLYCVFLTKHCFLSKPSLCIMSKCTVHALAVSLQD